MIYPNTGESALILYYNWIRQKNINKIEIFCIAEYKNTLSEEPNLWQSLFDPLF